MFAQAVAIMTRVNRDAAQAAVAARVRAVIDRTAVPVIEGAREALRAPGVTEDDLLLLADAQTSGGLLIVGELPGHPVIGHTVAGGGIEVQRLASVLKSATTLRGIPKPDMSAARSSRSILRTWITKGTPTTPVKKNHSMKSRVTSPIILPCTRDRL